MKFRKLSPIEIILTSMLVLFLILGIFHKKVVEEENNEYHFSTSKINEIDKSKIRSISGKYSYEDDKFTSSFGIDVSTFQDDINWEKVKNDDVEFAFIRIGRRGAVDGLIHEDDLFEANYSGAKENEINIGVYFFSQAINTDEAIEEARWVLDKLKDKKIELPIVYDCEDVYLTDEEARINNLSKEEITANALAFLDEINNSGYLGMIYSYLSWADDNYEMELLNDYPYWFAQYDVDIPSSPHPINIWQYSDKGTINGINHPVDLNIMFVGKQENEQ